jgi:hypothetical protein
MKVGQGQDADWARRQLFKRGLTLGDWANMLRQSVERCIRSQKPLPVTIVTLARAAKRRLLKATDDFKAIRNSVVGHGVRAFDPSETAELVVGCVESGKVQNLKGEIQTITPLAAVLATMVEQKAYDSMILEVGDGETCVALSGAQAADRWLGDERHRHHGSITLPVRHARGDQRWERPGAACTYG